MPIAIAMLPLAAVALALGRIFGEWISSVARNPGARDAGLQTGRLDFALSEAIVLLVLILILIMMFVI